MSEHKSILCIVPLPPPVTGANLVSETVVKYLRRRYAVTPLNYQKNSMKSGNFSLRQAFRVLKIGLRILGLRIKRVNFDYVYMVLSASFIGHLRDIFFLLTLGRDLRRKTVMHVHSSNAKKDISAILPPHLKNLAQSIFADVRQGIVLGKTWLSIYGTYIDSGRVVVINNYFDPSLLIPEEKLSAKFNTPDNVSILFLSNMIEEKGYNQLLGAFLRLPQNVRDSTELHFVGRFDSRSEELKFIKKWGDSKNISYHGVLTGDKKRELFWKSHIFCLPTLHYYEAQPLVILEAYASGCAVITTENGGIADIFADEINGFYINNFRDPELCIINLREKLEQLIVKRAGCKKMAIINHKIATEKYSKEKFHKRIEAVFH